MFFPSSYRSSPYFTTSNMTPCFELCGAKKFALSTHTHRQSVRGGERKNEQTCNSSLDKTQSHFTKSKMASRLSCAEREKIWTTCTSTPINTHTHTHTYTFEDVLSSKRRYRSSTHTGEREREIERDEQTCNSSLDTTQPIHEVQNGVAVEPCRAREDSTDACHTHTHTHTQSERERARERKVNRPATPP